jgi:hypothetical protein
VPKLEKIVIQVKLTRNDDVKHEESLFMLHVSLSRLYDDASLTTKETLVIAPSGEVD